MTNPLFKELGGNRQQQQNTPDMGKAFDQFARNFSGDPNVELQKLRQSGQMPPQIYNMLNQMANQIVKQFRK